MRRACCVTKHSIVAVQFRAIPYAFFQTNNSSNEHAARKVLTPRVAKFAIREFSRGFEVGHCHPSGPVLRLARRVSRIFLRNVVRREQQVHGVSRFKGAKLLVESPRIDRPVIADHKMNVVPSRIVQCPELRQRFSLSQVPTKPGVSIGTNHVACGKAEREVGRSKIDRPPDRVDPRFQTGGINVMLTPLSVRTSFDIPWKSSGSLGSPAGNGTTGL